ncbi:MAG: SDR family NAD(P)-dependent oxidoreductase [Dehalococcoidia bacterium]|nr:SDR family NAD(P)-dependent oxidoreductase [Dehalococcoidia bacterium]
MIDGRFGLKGKTAIITGAGSGLGRAMAFALADAGANVVGAARRLEPLEETRAAVEAKGVHGLSVTCDATDSDAVDAMVAKAIAEFGRVDILINNAGGGSAGRGKTLPELTNEDWFDGINTNLSSAFYCSRAIIPHYLEHGGGKVINITSGWGMRGGRGNFMYSIAKGGVIQLTKTLAITYARDNIQVTCIAPGSIPHRQSEEQRAQRNSLQPIGRTGYGVEIGPMAVLLASEASNYMSGEIVLLDGAAIAGGVTPGGVVPHAEG